MGGQLRVVLGKSTTVGAKLSPRYPCQKLTAVMASIADIVGRVPVEIVNAFSAPT